MTQAYGFSVSYDQFLPRVLQYVPDASEFIAVDAIKQACIEFCERTYFWQYEAPAINVVNGQSQYIIDTPGDNKPGSPGQAEFKNLLAISQGP